LQLVFLNTFYRRPKKRRFAMQCLYPIISCLYHFTLSFTIPDLNLVTNLLDATDNILLNLVALSAGHSQNEIV